MVVVGLTGGIGSGKSTVSALLAEHGAVVVDADLIARQVVLPGGAAYAPIVDRFGPGVLSADGTIDRPALADVVFRREEDRLDLETITHPAIQEEMARQMVAAGPDAVVILDIPLLKERRDHMAGVIVVDTPEDVAVQRLVADRGFDEDDARRRIGAQISRDQRRAMADVVIDNGGARAELHRQVDEAWAWLQTLVNRTEGVTGSR